MLEATAFAMMHDGGPPIQPQEKGKRLRRLCEKRDATSPGLRLWLGLGPWLLRGHYKADPGYRVALRNGSKEESSAGESGMKLDSWHKGCGSLRPLEERVLVAGEHITVKKDRGSYCNLRQ